MPEVFDEALDGPSDRELREHAEHLTLALQGAIRVQCGTRYHIGYGTSRPCFFVQISPTLTRCVR